MFQPASKPLRKRNATSPNNKGNAISGPRRMFMRRHRSSPANIESKPNTTPMTLRQRLRTTSVSQLLGYCLLLYTCILLPLQWIYFGTGDTVRGGKFGAYLDRRLRRGFVRQARENRMRRMQEAGIVLPESEVELNKEYTSITAETLLRRARRSRMLQEVERSNHDRQRLCESKGSGKKDGSNSIPPIILQPIRGSWYRSYAFRSNDTVVIPFEEKDMRQLVRRDCSDLLNRYDASNVEGQVILWSLCALYRYGGYIIGSGEIKEGFDTAINSQDPCAVMATAMFGLARTTGKMDLHWMATSPRHPHLQCVLDRINDTSGPFTFSKMLSVLYSPTVWKSSHSFRVLTNTEPPGDEQDILTSDCSGSSTDCCEKQQLGKSGDNYGPETYIKIFESHDGNAEKAQSPRIVVEISESEGTPTPLKQQKVSIRDQLRKERCQAGWLCNRCLRSPWHGSYQACNSVCRRCFTQRICSSNAGAIRKEVVVELQIHETRALYPGESLIPRVIHQTFSEELMVDRYPQLARVQNSWRNSGWQYRFYTDDDARNYIEKHYPRRFLDAFDCLMPGAFKADLFRYLVLLREGGIYADYDVLLNANLDSFITPSMSFFVPRDLVGANHDSEYCTWNGLIGAAPGHPFLVKVVEHVMTRILNRADAYDLEQELCLIDGPDTEQWKTRESAILFLSGPCALGMAINDSLGNRSRLSKHQLGWTVPAMHSDASGFIGDALLLAADKADMNAFRFTDLDRNIIVASTDMIDLTKTPLETPEDTNLRGDHELNKLVHYSETQLMHEVFGTRGVYIDDMTSNEVIRLEASHAKI